MHALVVLVLLASTTATAPSPSASSSSSAPPAPPGQGRRRPQEAHFAPAGLCCVLCVGWDVVGWGGGWNGKVIGIDRPIVCHPLGVYGKPLLPSYVRSRVAEEHRSQSSQRFLSNEATRSQIRFTDEFS